MFDEMTPVKACADFNYDISDNDSMVFLAAFNCFGFLCFLCYNVKCQFCDFVQSGIQKAQTNYQENVESLHN